MNLLMRFLLMCVGLDPTWGVLSHALVVRQSADVSILEGKTVNITCCWTGTSERVGVKWLKNQTLIKNKTVMNQSEGYWNKHKNKCENLTLENIKRTDSGRYICKVSVEIPVLSETEGNGTTISVTPRENPADSADHQTRNEKKTIDEVTEDKGDDNRKTHIVDKGKEKAVRHKEKTTDRPINRIAKDTKKTREKSGERKNQQPAEDGSQEVMFTFILRSLPIIALITAFFWLYYIGTKAQKEKAAASGNKASSQQRTEENQEAIVTKEAKGKRTKTGMSADHHVHPVQDVD
ncbi:uncharacterized protein LOC106955795 [Poecilia latipinna]|uniref:uncharacterized protein LOC106955795 n=1 Tax=Poecilia latipinna TaxID=48699 RepID=UPI00072E64FD|nr:PREDICTED: uncharacterized protein LOC106955795 [Poecilia latipinna]